MSNVRYRINQGKVDTGAVGNLHVKELGLNMQPGMVYDLDAMYGERAVEEARSLTSALGLGWVDKIPYQESVDPEPVEDEPDVTEDVSNVREEDESGDADTSEEGTDEVDATTNDSIPLEALAKAETVFDMAVSMDVIVLTKGSNYTTPNPFGNGRLRFTSRERGIERLAVEPKLLEAIEQAYVANDSTEG